MTSTDCRDFVTWSRRVRNESIYNNFNRKKSKLKISSKCTTLRLPELTYWKDNDFRARYFGTILIPAYEYTQQHAITFSNEHTRTVLKEVTVRRGQQSGPSVRS